MVGAAASATESVSAKYQCEEDSSSRTGHWNQETIWINDEIAKLDANWSVGLWSEARRRLGRRQGCQRQSDNTRSKVHRDAVVI